MITNVQHKDRKFDHAIINLQDINEIDKLELLIRYAEDNEMCVKNAELNEDFQYFILQLWQMINSSR